MMIKEMILFGLLGLYAICSAVEICRLDNKLNDANEKLDAIQRRLTF